MRFSVFAICLCLVFPSSLTAAEDLPQARTIVRDKLELVGVLITENLREVELFFAYGTNDGQGNFVQNSPPFTVTTEDLRSWTTAKKSEDWIRTLGPEMQGIKVKLREFMQNEQIVQKIYEKYKP